MAKGLRKSRGEGLFAVAVLEVFDAVAELRTDQSTEWTEELNQSPMEFADIIAEPTDLPPEREFDFEINLGSDEPPKERTRYGHRRAFVAAGGRRTRDEGVIWKGDPGDFYMKVIAKKFRGVWHYGVITGLVTEWVLEDYGGATQWRAVFEDGDIVDLLRSEVVEAMAAAQEHPPVDADGEARLVTVHQGDDLSRSGKVTVQSGWVMEDCLHHMETFSILNAGPLLEEARVKAIMTEKELSRPQAVLGHMYKRMQGAAWFVTRWGLQNVVTDKDGPERKAQVDALTREGRTRYPARRQGAAAGAARRQGAAAGAARRQGAAAGAARRQGAAAGAARRQGAAAGAARRQDSAYSGIGGKGCITSCGRQPLKTMRSCRNNPSTGFWIPLIWLTAAGCGMQGRMTEVAVLVSPQSLHAAEAAQPHRH
eukprot:jgi/Tetstr1/459643/TSEL_004999.t1